MLEVEMTLNYEFNGMVLGYKKPMSSIKDHSPYVNFFKNPCCCTHWLSTIISVATGGPKNEYFYY